MKWSAVLLGFLIGFFIIAPNINLDSIFGTTNEQRRQAENIILEKFIMACKSKPLVTLNLDGEDSKMSFSCFIEEKESI